MMSLRWGLTARLASHQHFAAVVDTDDFFAFGPELADPADDFLGDFLAGADKRNARGIGDDGTGADSAGCLLERHEFPAAGNSREFRPVGTALCPSYAPAPREHARKRDP